MLFNLAKLTSWLDSDKAAPSLDELENRPYSSSPSRWLPFIVLHLMAMPVLFLPASRTAILLASGLYLLRMFAITGFYHRYFSHRTFKTGRVAQFLFALIGTLAVQRGPLWWASHHRHHHRHSDTDMDVHSPTRQGFIWSHMGWITCDRNIPTDYERVRDLANFPELVLLNRFDWLPPLLLGALLYLGGDVCSLYDPSVSGLQLLAWGALSTVLLFHATSAINSIAHSLGSQPHDTEDDSRNNFILALLTLGEGWHNNHHRYPGVCRQGIHWWQIDLTYYGLLILEKLGVIWDVRKHEEQEKQHV